MKSSKKYSSRKFEAFCIDLSGKSALITRYIRPQNPPAEFANNQAITLRYVSLIPFLEDSVTFVGRTNVWSTSKQFLAMRAGDWEEHSILLCNYFLYMKMEAWVTLGSGIEGDMSYVLVKTDNLVNPFVLYDPCAGEIYNLTDLMCPLRDIGCIFNQTNVSGRMKFLFINRFGGMYKTVKLVNLSGTLTTPSSGFHSSIQSSPCQISLLFNLKNWIIDLHRRMPIRP
jgi:coiled-coil and C2 domain-containing protein 2A